MWFAVYGCTLYECMAFYVYVNSIFLSCACHHVPPESVLHLSSMPASYQVCVWICLSAFGASLFVCGHVFVCPVRVMWHGGHFCQIQRPDPCCDVKGTVKRQPRGSAGTAALSALFPLWHTHTHWRGHTDKHIHACFKLTHDGGKTPQGESPRIVQCLQNKRYRLLVDYLFAAD